MHREFGISEQTKMFVILCFILISTLCSLALCDDGGQSEPQYTCLDTNTHKSSPGRETKLFQQCEPWKDFACCSYETTERVHNLSHSLYNFNFHHCPHKRDLSDECQKHFIQDLCFYECSPNMKPWIVKVQMKTRREKFVGVPLCASECQDWFDACADDFTCTDNWIKGFLWDKNGNRCRPENECLTIKEIFQTSTDFCQKVWNGSWKVVSDDEPCMKIWFDGAQGNPNTEIVKKILALPSPLPLEDNDYPMLSSSWSLTSTFIPLPFVTSVLLNALYCQS